MEKGVADLDQHQSPHHEKIANLVKSQVSIYQELDRWIVDDLHFDVIEVIAGRMAFRLAATILSEPQNYKIKHPANWWEAVKERFLPDKLKKKYPVKYTVYDINVRTFYPKTSLPDLEHKHHIELRQHTQEGS